MRLGQNQKLILWYLNNRDDWTLYRWVQSNCYELYGIIGIRTKSQSASMSRSVKLLLKYGLIKRRKFGHRYKSKLTGATSITGIDPGLAWELQLTEAGKQKVEELGITFD